MDLAIERKGARHKTGYHPAYPFARDGEDVGMLLGPHVPPGVRDREALAAEPLDRLGGRQVESTAQPDANRLRHCRPRPR